MVRLQLQETSAAKKTFFLCTKVKGTTQKHELQSLDTKKSTFPCVVVVDMVSFFWMKYANWYWYCSSVNRGGGGSCMYTPTNIPMNRICQLVRLFFIHPEYVAIILTSSPIAVIRISVCSPLNILLDATRLFCCLLHCLNFFRFLSSSLSVNKYV